MKVLKLKRVSHTQDATFGVLIYESIPFCVTLELPWRDNKRNVSCIPEGFYVVQQADQDEAYEIMRVPERSGIQIEVANKVSELRGCIAVGEKFQPLGDCQWAIQESRKAFTELKGIIGETRAILDVVPPHRHEYLPYRLGM